MTQVAGRRIVFKVWAMDGAEAIGEGTHERVLIDVAKFAAHLAAKVAGKPGE